MRTFWEKWKSKLIPLATLIAVVFLVWHAFGRMLPGLIPLLQEGNEEKIAAYLAHERGIRGAVSVLLLSMIQVVSVVLPGMAIWVAAGMIYTWWKAFIVCYTGFVTANTLVFWFDRSMGSEHKEITLQSKTAQFLHRLYDLDPVFMVGVAFMIPGVPNGIVPHVAARSKATLKQFIVGVAGCSWIQILASCLAGSFLIQGEWLYTFLCVVVQVLLTAIVVWRREFVVSTLEDLRYFRNRVRNRLTGSDDPGTPEEAREREALEMLEKTAGTAPEKETGEKEPVETAPENSEHGERRDE